jgi:hypothetical protein
MGIFKVCVYGIVERSRCGEGDPDGPTGAVAPALKGDTPRMGNLICDECVSKRKPTNRSGRRETSSRDAGRGSYVVRALLRGRRR